MNVEPVPDAGDRQTRLEEVLAAYFEADGRGAAPERQQVVDQHPDLADDLIEFFNVQAKLHVAAAMLRPPPPPPALDAGDLGQGRTIGDYEILGLIARGGMGVVYKANQRSLNRVVALKMLPAGDGASSDDPRRFQREAEAIARLDHAHIVPVYETGQHDGHYYFSMKLVEGASLADRIDDFRDKPREAARIVAAVARAIHHAHERGLLHRDLKPSNVLIDEGGHPLVVDFGLAVLANGDNALTRTGIMPGTPAYMAPEQVDGRRRDVTAATDVHGLGTILYALLTGRPPFRGVTPWATLQAVRDQPPDPPRSISGSVDRDLETICLKCLEKEPGRRFGSAAALAEDLERWLAGRPITARRIGAAGSTWRLARRHPLIAALACAVLTLTALSAFGFLMYARSDTDRVRLDRQARRSAQAIRADQVARDLAQAWQYWGENRLEQARDLLDRTRPAPGEPDLRGFAWHYLHRLVHVGRPPLKGHQGEVYSVAFSPDGTTLVTASQDRTIKLWNLPDRTERLTLKGHTDEVNCAVFSPDGHQIASASDDSTVKLWEVSSGRCVATFEGNGDKVVGVVFSSDGRLLFSARRDGNVVVWEVGTRAHWQSFTGGVQAVQGLAVSPDDKFLAIASKGTGIWEPRTADSLACLGRRDREARSVAFSRDGAFLAVGGPADALRIWEPGDWLHDRSFFMGGDDVESVAWLADNKTIAVVGVHGNIRLRHILARSEESIATGQKRTWCVATSSDGRNLATASSDGTVKLWDLGRDRMRVSVSIPSGSVSALEFSPDGTELTSAAEGGRVWVQDSRSGRIKIAVKVATSSPIVEVALSRDGRSLLTESASRTIALWSLPEGRLVRGERTSAQRTGSSSLALSAAGRLAVRSEVFGTTVIWDTTTGSFTEIPNGNGVRADDMRFSPREDVLSVWGFGVTSPILWDFSSREFRGARTAGHSDHIRSQAFSQDGSMLATGGRDGTIMVWNVEALEPVAELLGLSSMIRSLAFAPNGRELAVGAEDGLVSLWDITSKRKLTSLKGHSGPVVHVRFSPDGQTLATAAPTVDGSGTELFLWSVAPPE